MDIVFSDKSEVSTPPSPKTESACTMQRGYRFCLSAMKNLSVDAKAPYTIMHILRDLEKWELIEHWTV